MERIEEELKTMQTRLLEKARAFRDQNSHTNVDSLEQLKQHLADSTEKGKFLDGFLQVGVETMLVKKM